MLDWIFEGIVTWISSVVSDMMDAVSGLFLQALGTDMTAMEEYFPFVSKAFTVSLCSERKWQPRKVSSVRSSARDISASSRMWEAVKR